MDIKDTIINKIFNNLDVKVEKIEKIKTLSNLVFKVTSNKDNYFLKIFENKEESKKAIKLAKIYPILDKNKIPTPKLIKFDNSLEILDFCYLVLSEVEGERLRDVFSSMEDKNLSSLYYDLGIALGKIHSITFNKFDSNVDSWKKVHSKLINQRLNSFKNTKLEDLIKPIKKWFEANYHLIDYNITPRLLHGDFIKKNSIIKDNKISGIIDFDEFFIGHNEEELMRTSNELFSENDNLKAQFFKGYTELIKLDTDYEKRLNFYYFSRYLVYAACVINFGDNFVDDIDKEMKEIRNQITNMINGIF